MNRDDLAKIAKKSPNITALRTALRAHLKTEKGQKALANAPLYYGAGLPRPMTVEDAVDALVEEASVLMTTPKGKKN